jgi:putative endonuclease
MNKSFWVYIMTTLDNSVLYTGVTNDLIRRAFEHREGLVKGFTQKYHVKKLVYFENGATALSTIAREKQIKGGSRSKKIQLIESVNPKWDDLWHTIKKS